MYGYMYLLDSGAPKGGHDTVKRRVSFLCALLPLLALLGCGNNSQAHPFVGGPYADFVARYGEPYLTAPSTTLTDGQAMFTSDGDSSVVFKVSPTSGNVSLLVATGPASWTDQDAMAFCKQFLPVGATKTDAATSHQTFHADVGDLRLDVAAAACDLTIIT